ncbi:uncharacterized protein BXZ73DRAFT_44548 [Epithele typhae]|uniref:uncharacterized protein n=1 Tax=Epithele typhae TaxID=378194 RepID=UPI002007FFB9|nr:uncharacterized protein BXZ73DRAFT_44548 [Epithele typhae]KAH9938815.1 hypothetical protein BXZ73DRAFT_44548 [Epithele typhae]
MAEVLPHSPMPHGATFGSAPRPRRPSEARPLPPSAPNSQPGTPNRINKALPAVPQSSKKPNAAATRSKTSFPTRRPTSPDVETMIAKTPRPRRQSSATFHQLPGGGIGMASGTRSRTNSSAVVPSSWRGAKTNPKQDTGAPLEESEPVGSDLLEKAEESEEEDGGSESDSSIDIHTPLPHLMFRDGLLSPRSKLLPGGGSATLSMYLDNDEQPATGIRANSVLSLVSTSGSTMTKSGVHRDPRDTQRRRVRHRDQQLLRAGMGLTTGLGWSDSEDEDAPSLLTRRLINTNLARQPSASASRPSSKLSKSSSVGHLPHAPTSYSPVPRSGARTVARSASQTFSSRLSIVETESITSIDLPSRPRSQSNASASSLISSASRDSSSAPHSVASSQNAPSVSASVRSATSVPRPLRLPQTAGKQGTVASGHSVTRSTSAIALSATAAASATAFVSPSASTATTKPAPIAKAAAAAPSARTRSRTHSNPGPRPMHSLVTGVPRPAASKAISPRALQSAVMAPVRSAAPSSGTSTPAPTSACGPGDFPLPPTSTPAGSFSPLFAGVVRPNPMVNINLRTMASSPSPMSSVASPLASSVGTGAGGRVLNTVGVGRRPPRTGTGMAYRNSSYSSMYETSRLGGRTSIAS